MMKSVEAGTKTSILRIRRLCRCSKQTEDLFYQQEQERKGILLVGVVLLLFRVCYSSIDVRHPQQEQKWHSKTSSYY